MGAQTLIYMVILMFGESRKHLIDTIAAIHCGVLSDHKHLPWTDTDVDQKAGSSTSRPSSQPSTVRPKRGVSHSVNLTSRALLLARIKHMECLRTVKDRHMPYVGPNMFVRFIECFRRIYTGKSKQLSSMLLQLR